MLKHLYIFAGQKIGNTMLQVHTAAFVADFLAGKSVQMLEHPPYRIDLALADFWFFPRVKIALAGKTLSAETFKKESAGVSKMIAAEEYAAAFQKWEDRHNKSDRLAVEYVENLNKRLTPLYLLVFFLEPESYFEVYAPRTTLTSPYIYLHIYI